jgi:hypothetical protein
LQPATATSTNLPKWPLKNPRENQSNPLIAVQRIRVR